MDDIDFIKDLIHENISSKSDSDKVLHIFNFIQELLEKDENITSVGNLKTKSLNKVIAKIEVLFEDDIDKLRSKEKEKNGYKSPVKEF